MESIEDMVKYLPEPLRSKLLGTYQKSSQRSTQTGIQETARTKNPTFECEICQDKEYVPTGERNTFRPCSCVEVKRARQIIERSGIAEGFRSKTVREYQPSTPEQKRAKEYAIEYIRRFAEIEHEKNNGIAFLGNPGAGKTHLTIAIANALLAAGIEVRYMQYREAVTALMQNRFDEEAYIKAMAPWKNCRVLLLDDVFKGAVRRDGSLGVEGTIMFEILNHRYLGNKPVLVSSEYTIDRMLDLDEAIGSRIAEMAKGRTVQFIGRQQNYRMK